jgi:predicted XRE-type DNA-binding protein
MKHAQRSRPRGNVFRDLGFSSDEADHLRIRSELMARVQKVITAVGLKQAEAAELLGVTQPRVSDLMRGRIDLFNVETLIDMLAKLGIRTKLVLRTRRKGAEVASRTGERPERATRAPDRSTG